MIKQDPVEQPASGDECVLLHDSQDPYMGSDPVSVRGSVLFTSPVKTITCRNAENIGDAFAAIEQALDDGLYVAGGFTYELGYHLENRLRRLAPRQDAPLFQVVAFREMTRPERDAVEARVAGRLAGRLTAPSTGLLAETSTGRLAAPSAAPSTAPITTRRDTHAPHRARAGGVSYGLGRPAYEDTLARLHDYIVSGDIYQANFTFPARFAWPGDVWQLYATVAPFQNVAFGAVLDLPDFKVASLSPELFFRKRGRVIESRPMKGTIRRGRNDAEDASLRDDLRADIKNRAENLMIVDLVRNDLGRMAVVGSVSVDNLFQVETYATLHQMVSTVRAEIDGNPSLEDIFRHLFPCGSVTGAPKIRAMEIIAELETAPRGIYTGAIGYITPARDMTMSVPIRTITLDPQTGMAAMGIGSGVVADSQAADEYDECVLKSQFLLDALAGEPADLPGLIETMRSVDGDIPLLAEHQARLSRSASALGIAVSAPDVWSAVRAHIRNTDGAYRVRLEVRADGTWQITSSVLTAMRADRMPAVMMSPETLARDNPLLAHKTTQRDVYDRARQALEGMEGAFDVLLFNDRGELCEGAIANVFIERDGRLLTPQLSCGLLPGIMRARVIAERGAVECVLRKDDLLQADRIFVSNAVRGLMEVRLIV